MKTSIFSLLLIALYGCGNAAHTLPMPMSKQSESLNGLSAAQIIKLKYTDGVKLQCSIWVQEGREIDATKTATDGFSIEVDNNLKNFNMLEIIKGMQGEFAGRLIVKQASVLEIIPNLGNIEDVDGKVYQMEYTPVVNVTYFRTNLKSLTDGSITDSSFMYNVIINENIHTRVYKTIFDKDPTVAPITEEMRCMLKTNIRPEYSNHSMHVK